MRDEYRFDYSTAKPNRFASRMRRPVVAIVLEPDVAAVFDSSAKVNARLRCGVAVIGRLPWMGRLGPVTRHPPPHRLTARAPARGRGAAPRC